MRGYVGIAFALFVGFMFVLADYATQEVNEQTYRLSIFDDKFFFILLLIFLFSYTLFRFVEYAYYKKSGQKIICCEEGLIINRRKVEWKNIESIVIRECDMLAILAFREGPDKHINLISILPTYIYPKEIYFTDKRIFVKREKRKGYNFNDISIAGLNFLYILRRRAIKARWSGDVDIRDLVP